MDSSIGSIHPTCGDEFEREFSTRRAGIWVLNRKRTKAGP